MLDIKAIFLDYDWTLYDHNVHDFHYEAIDALKSLKDKGIKLFINSARTYYSLKGEGILDMIDFDGYGEINGIATLTKDKVLDATYISSKHKEQIFKILNNNKLNYLISTVNQTFIKVFDENDENIKSFYGVFKETYPLPISSYNQKDELISIQFFIKEDQDYLFDDIKDEIYYNRFGDMVVEINEHIKQKKDCVNALLKEFNISYNQAVAIGDDINDIDMFESVKYSICMGNGHPDAKQKAYMITTNIDDNGIINALKELHLI